MDTVLVFQDLTAEKLRDAMTKLSSTKEELGKVEFPLKYAYIFNGLDVLLVIIYVFVFITYYV
jgi:ABC-type proline/glycine betaine transport system permease subunit